ncbi:hypothetical protein SK128_028193 [Halocaridina rubra]|uniref:RING-type domain-containing protein n=1 Tax=Halocaridina rubra TaxID=373956 RepID=A0AAN9A576_HALRR
MEISSAVCKSCEEPYSTRRIPRILDCGHCLCTACINCTIKSSKKCPVCNSIVAAFSTSSFPVDESVVNIIKTVENNMNGEDNSPRLQIQLDEMPTRKTADLLFSEMNENGESPQVENVLSGTYDTLSSWVNGNGKSAKLEGISSRSEPLLSLKSSENGKDVRLGEIPSKTIDLLFSEPNESGKDILLGEISPIAVDLLSSGVNDSREAVQLEEICHRTDDLLFLSRSENGETYGDSGGLKSRRADVIINRSPYKDANQVSTAEAISVSVDFVSASYFKEKAVQQYSRHREYCLADNYQKTLSSQRGHCQRKNDRELSAQRNKLLVGVSEEPLQIIFNHASTSSRGNRADNVSDFYDRYADTRLIKRSNIPRVITRSPEMTHVERECVGRCPQHDRPISFMCMPCNMWGCKSCPIHPEGNDQCFLLDPLVALRTFKLIFSYDVSAYTENVERVKKSLEREMSSIDTITSFYKNKAAIIRAELESIENNIEEIRTYAEIPINSNTELCTSLQELKNSYRHSRDSYSYTETVHTMEVLRNCQKLLEKYPMSNVGIPLIPNIRLNKLQDIIGLLEAGAPLYGIQEGNGGKRFSQLTLCEDQLLLHCLREDVHPNEGVALLPISYTVLREMVPEVNTTLFMDIGWAGERRGRVFVRIFGNNPRGRQAIYLCSGEKRKSYRNTIFYHKTEYSSWMSSHTQEILYGGDYENNDGTGGKAIVEDITNGGVYKHSEAAGLMAGYPSHEYWRAGAFHFYTYGDWRKYTETGFGTVTEGLEILRTAAKQDPVSTSYICDSGLVIPVQSL